MKEILNNKKKELLVIVLSILILIVGSITIGFIWSLLIVLGITALYFGKDILDFFQNKGKKNIKRKTTLKKTINYSKNNKTITIKKDNKTIKKDSKTYQSKNNKNNTGKKKTKKKKTVWKKILLGLIIFFTVGFILAVVAVCLFCFYIVDNAPEFNPEELKTQEPTIIYDKDGNEIARIGLEQRRSIEYEEIPEVLINAIIATEDSQFFQHNGVDIKRFLKASTQQLMGIDAGGASTITMQLSKNTYTSEVATGIEGIIRKFTDVYIAVFKIETEYTKEDILKFYVNSYFMGGGYGVEQTSYTYFGKSARDLNLAEAAMIAGLFQAPGKYNPYTNPEATEKRRITVLNLMLRHGYINKQEYDIAAAMTVDKIVQPSGGNAAEVFEHQSFIDHVMDEVREKTGKDPALESMKIYTTLDPEKQKYVNDIMNGVTYDWENDVVKAGVSVVDVETGAVVAIGGGRNIDRQDTLNYATEIRRQIGSTAKPLYDYGPAIEYLNWNTYTIVADEPITYSDGTSINNWDGGYHGFETMRAALTYSRNIPALKAFKANDKSKILLFVTNLGLTPEITGTTIHEAHAIGGYPGESSLTMASAYAAFANGGYYTAPYSFTKIEFSDGTYYDNVQTKKKVMSEQTAFMMSSMLIDTAKYALGYWSNINGQQYGAKTGTTNFPDDKLAEYNLLYSGAVNDLWTVGFNTDYAIGVWYGYDQFDGVHYNHLSSGQHLRLFQAVGKGIFTNNETFTQPEGVEWVTIEYGCPTACLPSEHTPANLLRSELFISGTEPTTVSDRFDTLDDVTNLKATASGNTVTLTWTKIKTPRALDEAALKAYYANTFQNQGSLNAHVASVLQTNKSMFGQLGYNVYSKDANGNLTLLGFTTDSTYKINNQGGQKTYVVKASYSLFTDNMSAGKSVTIKLSEIVTPTNKEVLIKQLYTGCVGRTATSDEISTYSSYTSASLIAYNICNSAEASTKYGKAETAIPSFYKGILNRTNTEEEYDEILVEYNKGKTNALKAIINSDEFKTYCTNKNLTYTEV